MSKEINSHQENDAVCQTIIKYCLEGWPEQHLICESVNNKTNS